MKKYIYRGTDADGNEIELDITLDIRMKIEQVTAAIEENYGLKFDDVIEKFLQSDTFRQLGNPDTKLWRESSTYIVDEFIRELMQADIDI